MILLRGSAALCNLKTSRTSARGEKRLGGIRKMPGGQTRLSKEAKINGWGGAWGRPGRDKVKKDLRGVPEKRGERHND